MSWGQSQVALPWPSPWGGDAQSPAARQEASGLLGCRKLTAPRPLSLHTNPAASPLRRTNGALAGAPAALLGPRLAPATAHF